MKKEEFKEFVRKHPNLIKYVKSNEMTWQKFYEMYDLYGEEESIWKDYLGNKNSENNTKEIVFGLIKGFYKELLAKKESFSKVCGAYGVKWSDKKRAFEYIEKDANYEIHSAIDKRMEKDFGFCTWDYFDFNIEWLECETYEDYVEYCAKAAEKLGIDCKVARIHSSDVFYQDANRGSFTRYPEKYGANCVEMESFALFHNAKVLGKKAACILTISDSLVTHQETSADERQNAFTAMMKIALEAAE